MYKEVIEKLCCPYCHKDLSLKAPEMENDEIISGRLLCACGRGFWIREGIADFESCEQENMNSWSEYYAQESDEKVDKKLDSVKTEHQQRVEREFLQSITDETSKLSDGFLLDIASGRGILLRELIKTSKVSVHIISTDLSFEVLKYDRMKIRKLAPNVKVSFLACDATRLPIKDDIMDMVCTYVGFVNMGNLAQDGIQETARVLKPGSKLVNSCVFMNESAPGFQRVSKILRENGAAGAEQFFLKENVVKLHRKYFSSTEEKTAYEGIAEESADDLIPCAGEWFADVLVIAQK